MLYRERPQKVFPPLSLSLSPFFCTNEKEIRCSLISAVCVVFFWLVVKYIIVYMAKRGREGNSELPPGWLAFVVGAVVTKLLLILFCSFRFEFVSFLFVSAFNGRLIFLSVLLFIVSVLALFVSCVATINDDDTDCCSIFLILME